MRRTVSYVGQAHAVMRRTLREGEFDPNSPDLYTIKSLVHQFAIVLAASRTVGESLGFVLGKRAVHVYLDAIPKKVAIYSITATYDGGRSYVDPLSRYR